MPCSASSEITAQKRAAILRVPEGARVETKAAGTPRHALADADGRWFLGSPPAYSPRVTAYDSTLDRLLLFEGGGYSYSRDIGWQLAVEGEGPWAPLTSNDESLPLALDRTASVRDTRRDRMLMFGGEFRGQPLWDVFAVDNQAVPQWSAVGLLHSSLHPDGRAGAYVAYDSKRDRLVIFGGIKRLTCLDDVWTLNLSGLSDWTQLHPSGTAPTARSDGSAVYDPVGDRILVYGGQVQLSEREFDPTDELWELDLATLTWRQPPASGSLPLPHVGHAAQWDAASGSMLIVGGWVADTTTPFLYDPVTETWTKLAPAGVPRRPTRSPIVYDSRRDRYLLFGGGSNAPDERDVDVLTLRPAPAWSSLPAHELPGTRFAATSVTDTKRDRLVYFGGTQLGYLDSRYLSNVETVPFDDPLHPRPLEVAGVGPTPRQETVGIYDPLRERAVFFGGWTYPSNYFTDVWTLSLGDTPTWEEAHPAGDGPSGRRAHAAAYDPLRDRMLVFGGVDDDVVYDDLWALDLSGAMRWERLVPRNEGPGPRFFMSTTYEPSRDALIVHGGRLDSQSLGDTWRLRLADLTWERLDTGPYGNTIERHVASYDGKRDRLIVHGGWAIDYDVIWLNSETYTLPLHGDPKWTWLQPELSDGRYPPAAGGQAEGYDERRDRLVVFGGSEFIPSTNDRSYLQFSDTAPLHARPLAATTSPGAAHVVWEVIDQPGATLTVERMEEGGLWLPLGAILPDANSRAAYDDTGLRPGWRYSYRLRIDSPAGTEEAGTLTLEIAGLTGIDFAGARPNPARASEVALWFSLPAPADASVALYDLRGRVAWSRRLPGSPAGPQVVRPDVALRAGLYFAEIRSAGKAERRKVAVLP